MLGIVKAWFEDAGIEFSLSPSTLAGNSVLALTNLYTDKYRARRIGLLDSWLSNGEIR